MNYTRLESMFQKKHASPMHADKPRNTYASHAHTHDAMYVHMYTCTHCGRKGHLKKFCYDRSSTSNFANKFVRVRKCANPYGPKKIWVPKSAPILFDVGVSSHLT